MNVVDFTLPGRRKRKKQNRNRNRNHQLNSTRTIDKAFTHLGNRNLMKMIRMIYYWMTVNFPLMSIRERVSDQLGMMKANQNSIIQLVKVSDQVGKEDQRSIKREKLFMHQEILLFVLMDPKNQNSLSISLSSSSTKKEIN